MKFSPLFEILLAHDYYQTGLCPDFQLAPSTASEPVLRNHRILFRSQAHGCRAYMEIDQRSQEVKPIVPLMADTRVIFHLRLKNPQFQLFTLVDERLERTVFDPELGQRRLRAAPYYSNDELTPGQGGELALGVRRPTHREELTVVSPQLGERFILNGKPRPGLQTDDFTLLPDSTEITHYDEAAQRLTADTHGVEKGTRFTVSYPVIPTLARGVFADIELTSLQALMPGPDPVRFTLSFKAPAVRWVYYFVTDKTGSVGNGTPTVTDGTVPPRIEFDRWQLHPANSAAEEYDLRLRSVNATDDLEDVGHHLVIVALVGADLHIRIFDAIGDKVVDKAENELVGGEAIMALKRRLDPFPEEAHLSQQGKREIIDKAKSITGLAEVVSDTIADQIAKQYPEHHRFRLLSRQSLPCRQAAMQKLELSFGTLNHPLTTNLANPSFRNISEIVIKRGPDPPQPVKSIFHVIAH